MSLLQLKNICLRLGVLLMHQMPLQAGPARCHRSRRRPGDCLRLQLAAERGGGPGL